MSKREPDEHAIKAAAILREGEPLSPQEQAAAKVIKDGAWILWHANERDLCVAKLLHRAGLLRDVEREQEAEQAHASLRRMDQQQREADRTLRGHLTEIVTGAVASLRAGKDPAEVADLIEALYGRACEAHEQALRIPGLDGTGQDGAQTRE